MRPQARNSLQQIEPRMAAAWRQKLAMQSVSLMLLYQHQTLHRSKVEVLEEKATPHICITRGLQSWHALVGRDSLLPSPHAPQEAKVEMKRQRRARSRTSLPS